jgi:hypothetical protein
MKKAKSLLATAVALLGALSLSKGHGQSLGPNGHYYEIVAEGNLLWEQARLNAAQSTFNNVHGHLATIRSADENAFIESLRVAIAPSLSVWIGGFQLTNAPSSSSDWSWINGEGPIAGQNGGGSFANWAVNEPNDASGPNSEQHVALGIFGSAWSSERDDGHVQGYVIEYPSAGAATIVSVVATDPIAAEQSGSTGLNTATFEFRREGNLAQELPIFFTVSGTAVMGDDYDEVSRSIIITSGESRARLGIVPRTNEPDVVESMETVGIRIDPSLILTPEAAYKIDDMRREAAAVIYETAGPEAALQMAVPAGGATFKYAEPIVLLAALSSSNAVPAVDFYASDMSGSASNKLGSADTLDATNELASYRFVWTNAAPGTYLITAQCAPNSSGWLSSSPLQITVNNPTNPAVVSVRSIPLDSFTRSTDFPIASFEVSRTGPTTENLQVHYAVSGNATAGADYETLPGYVVIGAGRRTARINLAVKTDGAAEGNELVVLSLTDPSNPGLYTVDETLRTAPISIVDVDSPAGIAMKGQWRLTSTDENAHFVTVDNQRAFLTTETGLRIIDVSDPQKPVQLGQVELQRWYQGIWLGKPLVDGASVYLVGASSALYRIDVSNPASPRAVAVTVPVTGPVEMALAANRLYVPVGKAIEIFDVSGSAAPVSIGRLDTGDYANDVKVADGLAYVAGENGLRIIDVTDPQAPWLVGSAQTGKSQKIELRGTLAYVLSYTNNVIAFQVVNISNPVSPTVTYAVNETPGPNIAWALSSSNAFVSVSPGLQVRSYDLSDPERPVRLGETIMAAYDLAVAGNYCYAAHRLSGLVIYNVEDPTRALRAGTFYTSTTLAGITERGGYVYLRDPNNGTHIIDARDPLQPKRVSTYTAAEGARSLLYVGPTFVSGNRAYISTWQGFDIVDVSNPSAPIRLGSYRGSGAVTPRVLVSANYAYTSALEVIDVSNPANPSKVATMPLPAHIGLMTLEGNFIYYAFTIQDPDSRYEVGVLDISNPLSPRRRGTFGDYGGLGYEMVSSYPVLFLSSYGSLDGVDVSNPDQIRIAIHRSYPGLSFTAMALSGGHMFRGDYYSLYLTDVSNPFVPMDVSQTNLPIPVHTPLKFAANGNMLYAAAGTLNIFEGHLGPVIPLPRLEAVLQPGKVILRWPKSFSDFQLYSTPSFGQTPQLVTSNPATDGDYYSFTNTRPVGNALFYMLAK